MTASSSLTATYYLVPSIMVTGTGDDLAPTSYIMDILKQFLIHVESEYVLGTKLLAGKQKYEVGRVHVPFQVLPVNTCRHPSSRQSIHSYFVDGTCISPGP